MSVEVKLPVLTDYSIKRSENMHCSVLTSTGLSSMFYLKPKDGFRDTDNHNFIRTEPP